MRAQRSRGVASRGSSSRYASQVRRSSADARRSTTGFSLCGLRRGRDCPRFLFKDQLGNKQRVGEIGKGVVEALCGVQRAQGIEIGWSVFADEHEVGQTSTSVRFLSGALLPKGLAA